MVLALVLLVGGTHGGVEKVANSEVWYKYDNLVACMEKGET